MNKVTAQSVDARVDKMGEWAKGVGEQIAALRVARTPSPDAADEISAELGGLCGNYASVLGDVHGHAMRRAEIASELSGEGGIEGQMADAEAQTYLEVCAETMPGNKPRYKTDKERSEAFRRALAQNAEYRQLNSPAADDTAKMRVREIEDEIATAVREEMLPVERFSNEAKREAAVRLRLQADRAYVELRVRKRDLELEDAQLRAQIEHGERLWSEYGRRERALVARLDNLTARL